MAMIKCPECGNDISDKAQACPHCGNPIASVFEKETKDTKSADELNNYLALARRAKEENNSENAARYYDLVLQKDPLSWEGAFYQVYYTAMQCKIMNIAGAARSVANCLDNVMYLIKEHEAEANQTAARTEVAVRSVMVASMLSGAAKNHYSNHSTVTNAFDECASRVVASGNIYESLVKAYVKNFPDCKAEAGVYAEQLIKYLKDNIRFYNRDYAAGKIKEMGDIIRETKPEYVDETLPAPPTPAKSGCYVATAVYGSYDCPQVWTLRRYRDYELAETWYGRLFIHTYYAVSPTLVKWFGHTEWFRRMWRGRLDRMVRNLQDRGFESTPYRDRNW